MMGCELNNLCLALFGSVGWKEVLVILAVILLLFGGRKLPDLARGLARGLRTFRDEMKGIKTDLEETAEIEDEQAETPQIPAKGEQPPAEGQRQQKPAEQKDQAG